MYNVLQYTLNVISGSLSLFNPFFIGGDGPSSHSWVSVGHMFDPLMDFSILNVCTRAIFNTSQTSCSSRGWKPLGKKFDYGSESSYKNIRKLGGSDGRISDEQNLIILSNTIVFENAVHEKVMADKNCVKDEIKNYKHHSSFLLKKNTRWETKN